MRANGTCFRQKGMRGMVLRRHSLLPFITIRRPCPRLFGWSPTCPNVTPPGVQTAAIREAAPGTIAKGARKLAFSTRRSIFGETRAAPAEPDERSKAPETMAEGTENLAFSTRLSIFGEARAAPAEPDKRPKVWGHCRHRSTAALRSLTLGKRSQGAALGVIGTFGPRALETVHN